MAVAADSHGAPAAATRAGVVVEEEAAGGIGTAANRGVGSFDQQFGGGASQGSKQPVEATFAGDKLQRPGTFLRDEFIMSFSDAQDFVDGLDPGWRNRLLVHDRSENGAKRFTKPEDAQEDAVDSLGLGVEKWAEAGGTILGNEAGVDKEGDEFVPGKIVGSGREVGEIEGEATGNELRRKSGHVTGESI